MTTRSIMSDEQTIEFVNNCLLFYACEFITSGTTDEEIQRLYETFATAWEVSGILDDPHTCGVSYSLSPIGVDVLLEHRDEVRELAELQKFTQSMRARGL